MAVIHHTIIKPTKLELLTSWLPGRPWYRGGAGEPELAAAGGFRLDDPAGEVGIEFIVVNDTSGPQPVSYLAPLAYRGAPLAGAEQALLGTMQHGVLGQRWIYDAGHDPVFVAELLALIAGRVRPQHRNDSDTVDHDITRSCSGDLPAPVEPGAATATDDQEGTLLHAVPGAAVRLHRVLRPVPGGADPVPADAAGHVAGSWDLPDGTRVRGLYVTVRPEPAG
ncbi:1,4-alpha-glucan branching protein [Streptomyces sp. Ru87]|uniref:maltokinase N-terminal cap-like domain-containing protein n=1 Tax=Streptomyces sp. Ru87 TaxID=2044307 RepID=UPI000BF808D5|nr:1,4-alpha-glucan branching protein [Streptomyces sp. Ru87]PGH48246.1 1,4-alpha-glucan branching protein [Streptomyces sp. Ru87]